MKLSIFYLRRINENQLLADGLKSARRMVNAPLPGVAASWQWISRATPLTTIIRLRGIKARAHVIRNEVVSLSIPLESSNEEQRFVKKKKHKSEWTSRLDDDLPPTEETEDDKPGDEKRAASHTTSA